MKITEKLIRPMTETQYLNVENTDRYRSIIRLFYLNYEKLKYWMNQEEIYAELTEDTYFSDYTPEQCQLDLNALLGWGNLEAIQDVRKVSTIAEFKNKKFRYQLSKYAIEIERMVIRLENLHIEGASLEPTLLERLHLRLEGLPEALNQSDQQLYTWWNDLKNDFVRLNQNYQDYMHDLNSMKAEEMMQSKGFLLFKDKLIEYLRSFVQSLQINAAAIEQIVIAIKPEQVEEMLHRVTQFELTIPRMDTTVSEKEIWESFSGRWKSITAWFVDTNGTGSEAGKVFDTTNEIIRKITRYAARISEQSNAGANRKEEYRKLAELFAACDDMDEAHKLAACVFGISSPIHFKGDFSRKTESIDSDIWEEEPKKFVLVPRVRTYRERGMRSGIVDRSREKAQTKQQAIQKLEREKHLRNSYIKGNRLVFAKLPVILPEVREVLLSWLSKAMERPNFRVKTEDGREYYIANAEERRTCTVRCTDGEFDMPAYILIFEDEEGETA